MTIHIAHRASKAFSLVEPKQSEVPAKAGIHLQRGFSLVELSIVLVILGLLVGGVLAGQSLIRAAELRAVSTEYSRWITANQTFRDKYFSWPGDFRDATRFWGRAAAVADCVTNSAAAVTSTSSGTCDGDGNGSLANSSAASLYGEIFLYWQHLARAGLIEGNYSGQAGAGAGWHTVPQVNAAASKLANSSWSVSNRGNHAGDAASYAYNYGNIFALGGTQANNTPNLPNMKPEEAWNIDTKLDDGRPGSGRILMRSVAAWGASDSCTTSTSQTDYAGQYRLNNSGTSCSLFFPQIL